MITYLYWLTVASLAIAILAVIGFKLDNWKVALAGAALVGIAGWAAYYFHFQQVFVKRWGGVMSISVPEGERHVLATWKEDNLWIENYDPATNTCIFREYSRGNLLQGKVTIRNCNPLHVQ
ncbi:MAG: hypothetical protein PVJ15_02880 [Gammaproteobacteria bacterium]